MVNLVIQSQFSVSLRYIYYQTNLANVVALLAGLRHGGEVPTGGAARDAHVHLPLRQQQPVRPALNVGSSSSGDGCNLHERPRQRRRVTIVGALNVRVNYLVTR